MTDKKKKLIANLIFAVMLLGTTAMAIIGIVLEKRTPAGFSTLHRANGFWAVCAVIPSASLYAFLANWLLLPKYKNRKMFSNICFAIAVVAFFAAGYVIFRHFGLLILLRPKIFLFMLRRRWKVFIVGSVLSICIFVASKVLSNIYAKLKGKE